MSGLVRGKPAPTGFSVSVSSYLRQEIARDQISKPSVPYPYKERWRLLEVAAHQPAAAGDTDPRVQALWRATVAEFGENVQTWSPGRNQIAVIHTALAPSNDVDLDQGALLNALCGAAVLDVEAACERKIADLKRTTDLPPTSAAVLAEMQARAETAERALSEARQSVETLRQAHVDEKSRRRELQAVLQGQPLPTPATNGTRPEAEPEPANDGELPTGVRRRGNSFQAFWREGGKQKSESFDTVEEAVAAREKALAAVAA